MIRLNLVAFAILVASCGTAAAATNPFHNYLNPPDVDANGIITSQDAHIVVNQILLQQVDPLAAQLAEAQPYYWDTSDDSRISAQDLLVVVNYLLVKPTPEPSTIALATMGLGALAGYGLRRRKRC